MVNSLNYLGVDASLNLSDIDTEIFFNKHSKYFKRSIVHGVVGVELNCEDLNNFLIYLYEDIYGSCSIEVLRALINEDNRRVFNQTINERK